MVVVMHLWLFANKTCIVTGPCEGEIDRPESLLYSIVIWKRHRWPKLQHLLDERKDGLVSVVSGSRVLHLHKVLLRSVATLPSFAGLMTLLMEFCRPAFPRRPPSWRALLEKATAAPRSKCCESTVYLYLRTARPHRCVSMQRRHHRHVQIITNQCGCILIN